ncbi:ribosome biogenesis protein SPATA5-like [Daktulosphaira vitifoliae]|uniref:ribosome biogenesis protein SPATA5-like n=1 Tax=Daktulosphaira vitifoliae TaxID=58002 RepID=UPI0021AAF604|nr:ribosome biogenesis protein SPATA5-like [Daktulosphaira vitifoliae]XP_050542408.1 ribosome biogenesis protein SPATA5-like [Daktulosphaira vitifoliae]
MTKPRRSTGPAIKYRTCDTCHSTLYFSDMETHFSGQCPPLTENWSQAYVHDHKLFSYAQLHTKDDEFLVGNDNVVVPIAAIQLCGFVLGEPVIVRCGSKTLVKNIWPSEELPLSKVFFSKDVLVNEFDQLEHVSIERFSIPPSEAQHIEVELTKYDLLPPDGEFKKQLLLHISNKYEGRIIKQSDFLCFDFYGRSFSLKVYEIQIFPCHNLEEQIKSLNLNNNFYHISSSTTWSIKSNVTINKTPFPLENIGGISYLFDKIIKIIETTKHYQNHCGILLHGISGTGKTLLANTTANSLDRHIVELKSWEILSKVYGQSEARLKRCFEEAIVNSPSVILIDQVDTFSISNNPTDLERRIINTMQSLFDLLKTVKHNGIAVLGTTRSLELVDGNLRRPGRFDYEVEVPVPNELQRKDILKCQLSHIKHNVIESDITDIAYKAQGFVGADLLAVVNRSVTEAAINDEEFVSYKHLCIAINQVKPSAIKEVLVQVPNVKWTDIGGQDKIKLKLRQVVEWPLKYPEAFERMGISPPRGVLLYGPPGCSKTMIAKAVATESHFNFISIKGPELFKKYVGESERAVRETFKRAKSVAPCVVFFDELDGLAGERGIGDSGSSSVHSRVLAQLLTELDGVQPLGNVTILAATNRPDLIDSALLRPGRLDRKVYVPLPDENTRLEILKLKLSKMPISSDVDITELIKYTENYSGAEVISICHEASLKAMEENIHAKQVEMRHFISTLESMHPQTPTWLLSIYEKFSGHQ